ncbi:hypothetical protein [Thermodesulforhabdus norvegica]|uniref:Uncharacterized protein n=1 Tax=Thermodesulforhabdus norvegica TaxID=39841 RepID=A0A1I4RAE0_9BACT|nr:hypothetical protein [Thermodesulforhabdus norvegica]SFM49242.1 hypothetical protein SAMN05660836_00506 [Thermodesulforhabdus norvegica]
MFEAVEVETLDFYTGQQEPRRFYWKNRWWTIDDVIDRWYEGYADETRVPMRYFRVRTLEGGVFILRYNQLFDRWALLVKERL